MGPFYWHDLTLILASNFIPYKLWDNITYSFSNFNIGTVEIWEIQEATFYWECDYFIHAEIKW